MNPLIEHFQQECAAANLAPEEVLARAGLHRATWFRWKAGTVSPTLRSVDAANRALDAMRARTPDQPEGAAA